MKEFEKPVGIIFCTVKEGESCVSKIAEIHKSKFGHMPYFIDGSQTINLDELVIYVCDYPSMKGLHTEVVQK